MHARQGFGLAHVNALDARVGNGTVQHLGDQHALQVNVRGERGLALHEFDRVHLGLGLAHPAVSLRLRHHLHLGEHVHRGGHAALHGGRWCQGFPVVFRLCLHSRVRLQDGGLFGQGHVLTPHPGRGQVHRFHNLLVPCAPAQDARDGLPDFRIRRVGVAVQQVLGGQDERGGAVTTLDGAGLHEGLLDGVQSPGRLPAPHRVLAQGLGGGDGFALHLGRQGYTGQPGLTLHQHGAVAAGAVLAAVLDAVIPQLAQGLEQGGVGGNLQGVGLTVDVKRYTHLAFLIHGG